MYYGFDVGKYRITLYPVDDVERDTIEEAIHRGEPLWGPYSVVRNTPHSAGGQHHLHIYMKKKKLFAINKDGTAHDQSHGCSIPSRVAKALRSKFPDYRIPADNYIEGVDKTFAEIIVEVAVQE